MKSYAAVVLLIAMLPTNSAGQTNRKSGNSPQSSSVAPRDVRSKNFLLHTDLNDQDAEQLLERLETMLDLISRYWGQRNRKTIECFVVKDLKNWPDGSIPQEGLSSIRSRAGLTRTSVVSRGGRFNARSIVYAYADRGTPQHEAVHAYCGQTFGRIGPVWYSEGMAEMGNYWQADDSSVNCHPFVIEYIHSVPPKSLTSIVDGTERTGDSWQNYSWRWALCHLLANNPNYRDRFRPLGLALLTGQDTSFGKVYGGMIKELSFEYRFFLEHVDIGVRADLIAWDWKSKFRSPRSASIVTSRISAKGGWQASRCNVREGLIYEYSAAGKWKLKKDGDSISADGDSDGTGKMIGAIFDSSDYVLGEPFELGAFGRWTAPATGKLFLRCREAWNEIDDGNSGTMAVRIKFADRGKPLSDPRASTEAVIR